MCSSDLLALNFLLMGVTIFCVGIAGEYVGRVYLEVRRRPRYAVRRTYGFGDAGTEGNGGRGEAER